MFAPSSITMLPFKVKVSSDREIRSVSDCIPILLVEKVKLPIFNEPLNSWTSSPVSPNWLEPEAYIIDDETNSVLNSLAVIEPDVAISPITDNVEDIIVAPIEPVCSYTI